MVTNALTIDVEDYYQVYNFFPIVDYQDWDSHASRVVANTEKVLGICREHDTKATFFVLGWVADRHPDLVRRIHEEGHEIGSHGYNHKPIFDMTPEEFRGDLKEADRAIRAAVDVPIKGYRAPVFSITRRTWWAVDILCDMGFEYDSSIFPTRHDRYGIPDAPRFAHEIEASDGRKLREFPLSTVKVCGRNLPMAGGGYIRLLPFWFIKWAVRRINNKEGQPVVVYLHPWEVDPDQPRLPSGRLTTIRHYRNIAKMESRLRWLLTHHRFARLCDLM
jgi:polysaccharide deacetylase family protein (PEP-CTERM system associated)